MERVWCREHDGSDEWLVSLSPLMLLLLSQKYFREILAFFFEVTRLGRVFGQIADGFFRVLLHLLLEFPHQDFGVFTH
jgi:hypothetical protein